MKWLIKYRENFDTIVIDAVLGVVELGILNGMEIAVEDDDDVARKFFLLLGCYTLLVLIFIVIKVKPSRMDGRMEIIQKKYLVKLVMDL